MIVTFEEQNRTSQMDTLRKHPMSEFVWMIGVRLIAEDCGLGTFYKGSLFVWVPATYPGQLIPYLLVKSNDPRREYLLTQLLDEIKYADPKQTISPLLLRKNMVEKLSYELVCYEYPFTPEGFVCPWCKNTVWNDPRNFVPDGCIKCGWSTSNGQKWSRKEIADE